MCGRAATRPAATSSRLICDFAWALGAPPPDWGGGGVLEPGGAGPHRSTGAQLKKLFFSPPPCAQINSLDQYRTER